MNARTALIATTGTATDLAEFDASARRYASASKAPKTLRLYADNWQLFDAWCQAHGRDPLPATVDTAKGYLCAMADAGYSMSSIRLARAAVAFRHTAAGHADPMAATDITKFVLPGIARQIGAHQAQADPVLLDDLRAMVAALDRGTLADLRNRALLLVGYAGAFRRSELAALRVEDVRLNGALRIDVRRSKTDQEGRGTTKTIPALEDPAMCPVVALRAYLAAAGIVTGPLFRAIDRWNHVRANGITAQVVNLIVKDAATRAGFDAAHVRRLSGHSLRRGMVTQASATATAADIMQQTGHKSLDTLARYIDAAGNGAARAVKAAFGEQAK